MKATDLMMMEPFVLKMSDVEDVVNEVGIESADVDKEQLREDLAYVFVAFREVLGHEKEWQDKLKDMISHVGALRKSGNSIIDMVEKSGYPMVTALEFGAKKYLLKNARDPSLAARVAFDPRAGAELALQQLAQLGDFVTFVNNVFLEIEKEYSLSVDKVTSEIHNRLFHDELRKVYKKHFPGGSRLQFDPITNKCSGPYLRFCLAVATKYHIKNRNGREYAEGSFVEFIRGRQPRSRRSPGQSRAAQAERETG